MNKANRILQIIRIKYQAKRKTNKWKIRKLINIQAISNYFKAKAINRTTSSFKKLVAPDDFSFINNTNEVLGYFNDAKNSITHGTPVYLDISQIKDLTPDTITLLMAKLSEKTSKKAGFGGNAPTKPTLKKMFHESGFYEYVKSSGKKTVSQNNRLWKHLTNNEAKGKMAAEAVEICKNLFLRNGVKYDTDHVYNLLAEAMSNTINHADKKVNWWLYYYIDEINQTIKYSFIDLGIGIFKSASFDSYRRFFSPFYKGNMLLVKPFLQGKIKSSRESDNEISGKGVKQIVDCANLPEFNKFILITNDVKIDIKTQESVELSSNFEGTFIYFEIACKI